MSSLLHKHQNPDFQKIKFSSNIKGLTFGALLVLISYSFSTPTNDLKHTTIEFYSDKITLIYNPEIIISKRVIPGEQYINNSKTSIQLFYEDLEKSDYQPFLNNLRLERERLNLNDWFYYELIKEATYAIYSSLPELHKRLAVWFLLVKEGYDARITYLDGEVFINVFTKDELFEVPMIKEGRKTFANLSSIHNKRKDSDVLYISNFTPNPRGKSFSFEIIDWPNLPIRKKEKTILFEDEHSRYKISVEFDHTVIELMNHYPLIAEHKYLSVPFSQALSNSILPILEDILEGKSNTQALRILASFTRKSFQYKTDEEVYGYSKPMVSEEVFHYQYSDCEDRSALFFNLARELLDIPMIVIAYQDHVTVAVATKENLGEFVWYKDRKYYVCDPTGPSNSSEIGKIPSGYYDQDFKVLAEYH